MIKHQDNSCLLEHVTYRIEKNIKGHNRIIFSSNKGKIKSM